MMNKNNDVPNNRTQSMIDSSDDTITISIKKYNILVSNSSKLDRLISNGVDNWEGYSIGLEEDEEEDE